MFVHAFPIFSVPPTDLSLSAFAGDREEVNAIEMSGFHVFDHLLLSSRSPASIVYED
jgi:hypothetical protein